MRKKQWLIIGIIILLISIITIVAIQSLSGISTPTVTVKIDAIQLSEDNVSINITMKLDNQNSYSLVLKEMDVELRSSQNTLIGEISFPKNTIPPHETRIIKTTGIFGFKNEVLNEFSSHITGDFGVNLFGIYSLALPVNITVITDPMLTIDAISLPTASLDADIVSINKTGVTLNGTIVVDNPNKFSISLPNTIIKIEHDDTPFSTNFSINDTIIKPRQQSSIAFSSFIDYTLFNTGKLSAKISADVNITVAGTSLVRPFYTTAKVNVPDISSFILNNNRLVIALSADFNASLSGLYMNVGFKLNNPTAIPLRIPDLDIMVHRIDNDTKTIIAQDTLRNCKLEAENETCLQTTFKLPVFSFLPVIGDGIPDWFLLSIIGNFTIADSNQQIPVQLNGYLSGDFFGTNSLNQIIT